MKKLLILFLILLASCAKAQNNARDFKTAILVLEAKRLSSSSIATDSLLVSKEVLTYYPDFLDIKSSCIHTGGMDKNEAEEIFGKKNSLFDFDSVSKVMWTENDFAGLKVSLVANHNDNSKPNSSMALHKILSISKPLIRNDGKFAIVHTANENDGGQLSIYKWENNTWEFYKAVLLYYI